MQLQHKKVIFILGSPRSGTTFIATEIAKTLKTHLYFEAQWIESSINKNQINSYTNKTWKLFFDQNPHLEIEKYFKKLSNKHKIDVDESIFIDHSPQNVLILKRLKKIVKTDLIIATLRPPKETIESLVRMNWYAGGINRAIITNLKYLIAILLNIRRIDLFIEINNYNQNLLREIIQNKISLKYVPVANPTNLVLKYPIDSNTYSYTEGKRKNLELRQKVPTWKIVLNELIYTLIKFLK